MAKNDKPAAQENAAQASDQKVQPSANDIAEAAGKIAAEQLAQAELAKNPQPGPLVQDALNNSRKPPISGSELVRLREEPTVTMMFPRPVLITLGDHTRISFPVGTQEVPESLANHQWLKRNGVKRYSK